MKINQNHTSPIDKAYYLFRTIFIISLPTLIISTLLLSLPRSSADNSSADNLTISVPSSCTLNATINSEHSTSTIGGTYIEDIGTTTLKTICNDANGFSIYTIGSSNSTEGNTKLVSSASSDYDIVTGTATSGNVSQWAMKLTPVSGTYTPNMAEGYNDQYVSIPNTWTKVASRPSNTDISADSSVAGSSLTTTYATYISSAQPAGTYTGQVKYLLVHPNNNSMNLTTLQMAFDNIVGPENKTTFNGKQYYRMQDMTTEICSTADVTGGGSQIQLVDDRINLDGEKRLYWVAKLADGHCWMTQNLDLDLIANHTYTHADTDLGWSEGSFDANATWTLTGGPSTIAWDAEAGQFTGWENSASVPYSVDLGSKYYYTSGTKAKDIAYNSLQDCIGAGHTDCEHYHTGNYYNWSTAIASNNSSSITSGNAQNSICPSGWRLPRALGDEVANLLANYGVIQNTSDTSYTDNGFNIIRNKPLYLVRSGRLTSRKILNIGGSEGIYLSDNAISGVRISVSTFSSTGVYPRQDIDNGTRASGMSIRCLAR